MGHGAVLGGEFGVVDDGGEGVRGGGGDGGVDADLVFTAVVEDLEVEGLVELRLEPGGGLGEDVAQERQGVKECGVLARNRSGEGGELGVDGGALFF